jgi:hypothetical protein
MKKRTKYIVLVIAALLLGGLLLLRATGKTEAPRQPIEFDHFQHVTKAKIDCDFCHSYADQSPYATVPSAALCMGCHVVEKSDSPEVQKLAAIDERGEQPPWVRVYWFKPEANVFFTHKAHVRAGIDCSVCHGNVAEMRRLSREVNQTMGWCIDCHKQQQASIDCYVCHR